MVTAETTFTDFLRNPNSVTRRLEEGDVILHRRGDADLRLSVASRASADGRVLELLSRIIAGLLRDQTARRSVTEASPVAWVQFLPASARERFYAELFECVEGAAEIGTLAPVARVLDEWQATAAIYADPDLAERLRAPLPGDGGVVARPGR
jgi:Family of unknown function (DUF6247)